MAACSDMKVIGVGLGRTGTLSMSLALPLLGFGPCYHMQTIIKAKGRPIPQWRNVHRGINPTENLHEIFQGFQSGVDYPQALYPEELYKAFPNAKFILTVRPFDKWKASFENTILRLRNRTKYIRYFVPFLRQMRSWMDETMFGPTHFDGDFEKNAEKVWFSHIDRVKKAIPHDQLLIYEVGEGWERLCQFLDVPVPNEPFPRVNDSASWQNDGMLRRVAPILALRMLRMLDTIKKMKSLLFAVFSKQIKVD